MCCEHAPAAARAPPATPPHLARQFVEAAAAGWQLVGVVDDHTCCILPKEVCSQEKSRRGQGASTVRFQHGGDGATAKRLVRRLPTSVRTASLNSTSRVRAELATFKCTARLHPLTFEVAGRRFLQQQKGGEGQEPTLKRDWPVHHDKCEQHRGHSTCPGTHMSPPRSCGSGGLRRAGCCCHRCLHAALLLAEVASVAVRRRARAFGPG